MKRVIFLMFLVLGMVSCSKKDEPIVYKIVAPESISLKVGERKEIDYFIEPTYKSPASIPIPKTEDHTIAYYDSQPKSVIVGVKNGKTYLILKAEVEGQKLERKVEIIVLDVEAESVSFSQEQQSIEVGSTLTLKLNVLPINTSQSVQWKSSDENIATINENGIVSAKSIGNCTITATVGNKSASCKIVVTEVYAQQIKIQPDGIEFYHTVENEVDKKMTYFANDVLVGDIATLNTSIIPTTTTNKDVVWTSSNPTVVSIENGKIKALQKSDNTIIITATTNNGKVAEIYIRVKNIQDLVVAEPHQSTSFTNAGVFKQMRCDFKNKSNKDIFLKTFRVLDANSNSELYKKDYNQTIEKGKGVEYVSNYIPIHINYVWKYKWVYEYKGDEYVIEVLSNQP